MTEYTIKLFATSDGRDADQLVTDFYDKFEGMAAMRCGEWSLTVHERGRDAREAALSAVAALETVGFSVVRVDQDLVDIPEIAERLHLSRQAVHKWATVTVGSGFPRPIGSPGGKRIWPWFEVLNWVRSNRDTAVPMGILADDATYVDAYLASRRDRVAAWSGVRLAHGVPSKREVNWPAEDMRYQERPLHVVGLVAGPRQ